MIQEGRSACHVSEDHSSCCGLILTKPWQC